MFFLAPLLFVALVLWLERGVPRPLALAVAAAAIPAALLFALPLASLERLDLLGHLRADSGACACRRSPPACPRPDASC